MFMNEDFRQAISFIIFSDELLYVFSSIGGSIGIAIEIATLEIILPWTLGKLVTNTF